MAIYTVSAGVPAMDAADVADTIELHCVADGPPLRISVGSGRTYRILAGSDAGCARLAHEAMRSPVVERVPGAGGLLAATTVLENILLPAVYHGRIAGERLAASVYEAFDACAMSHEQADALCERPILALDGFEQRLVCLLRALLMRPAALLCERIFEGLPLQDMERLAVFPGYYRRIVATGTVIFLDLAGMAGPEIAADIRVNAV